MKSNPKAPSNDEISSMKFTCFYTVYKGARAAVPLTVGYDASPSLVPWLASREAAQFVHSGNWWNIPPEKRTREAVFSRQVTFVNKHTAGLMSMNIQPGNDPLYWMNTAEESHLGMCLDNANYARDEARAAGVNVPIYCTLQPGTASAAERWFQRAVDAGHSHLSIGVSEFLRSPKHRDEGTRRILEITHAVKRVLGEKGGSIHLSGLTSYNLLPVVAALGATSTDGSTPVQSALAYGTVFDPRTGKGTSASALVERIGGMGWGCTCDTCREKPAAEAILALQDPVERVNHNLSTWEALVREINDHVIPEPGSWHAAHREKTPASRKPWAIALGLLEEK